MAIWSQRASISMHSIRTRTKSLLYLAAAGFLLARAADMLAMLRAGGEAQLLAFPLAVILPFALIVGLAQLPPTDSREGALMRLGTMIQLVAIIALPHLALYLALGLPVVFLVVELYETRVPASLRDGVFRFFVA
jgi:hypothetical protein